MSSPSPERYQPPLTFWSHVWRYALCLLISAVGWGTVFADQWEDHRTLWWIDLVLGTAAYALVGFRRRWPLPVALVLNAAGALSGFAAGPAVLSAVSLASRRVYWQVILLGLVSFSAGQVFVLVEPQSEQDPLWLNLSVNMVATVAILGWGLYIGSRRELLWTLRDQVVKAQQERDLRAVQARSSERSRIAREMHDVLAHRISQVSMHANAVMFREDLTAAQMRESVAIIQEKANEALVDLRSVLGVLRDADGQLLDKPQPTLADLPSLVEEARASGMHVEYVDAVDAGAATVPEVTGRTVYRIVQEALTNARKHAPGALVSIRVSGSEAAGIEVLVRNPLGFGAAVSPPPSGLGLVGLRERAELRGGRLDSGRDGSSWVLRGWIPWET